MTDVELYAPGSVGEVTTGADLASLVLEHVDLDDGDVVVLTSKVLSKAEGRVRPAGATGRDEAIADETVRVVATRGPVRIVENRLGLTMAAAGVDASNLPAGTIATLPEDPDATARSIRTTIAERTGLNVAVLVSDTAGRAWRLGQTDIAIGLAGLAPLESFAGARDGYGNDLAVTEPAVADEIAGAAELASGKLGGRPLVRVRGLAGRVLPLGDHGPGARSIIRPRELDFFASGTREAVVAALLGDRKPFGQPAGTDEVLDVLDRLGLAWSQVAGTLLVETPDAASAQRCALALHAYGWLADPGVPQTRIRPE